MIAEHALTAVAGHDGTGNGLKIRGPEPLSEVERLAQSVLRGRIPSWERVVVLTFAPGNSRHAFVLEPGPNENEIRHGTFYVRGRFAVVARANTAIRADRLWRETEVA